MKPDITTLGPTIVHSIGFPFGMKTPIGDGGTTIRSVQDPMMPGGGGVGLRPYFGVKEFGSVMTRIKVALLRIHETIIREIILFGFKPIIPFGVEGEISIRETDPGYKWPEGWSWFTQPWCR